LQHVCAACLTERADTAEIQGNNKFVPQWVQIAILTPSTAKRNSKRNAQISRAGLRKG
jgi:hypothetical protein